MDIKVGQKPLSTMTFGEGLEITFYSTIIPQLVICNSRAR